MGERKVLNKYFPPDFDPSKIPRRKQPKNKQIEVRMMLPFSIQCATCGEYMYRGKKFNSRKEDVLEEDYHGIKIFRFYIRCVTCASEITFKTDPQHGDYVAEHGCQRNFEPWRENEANDEKMLKEREEEEKGDSMKQLENRTLDSKREMDILDALDEIKAINQRHAKVDTDALLAKVTQDEPPPEGDKVMTEEDIQEEMELFRKRKLEQTNTGPPKKIVKATPLSTEPTPAPVQQQHPTVVVKKKAKTATKSKPKAAPSKALSLVGNYDSNSD
ncbi:coiled-coil domain-containing protein 94 [Thraustotheca clavata]|uniref:Splicing factor YJU2 n=1 Tax=Thraustotheca clavata TaxID=74557 RepID=A0A1W0A1I0_9STRA|nr:coiled-coil domain-containing protein 94 [Thraustotheca clavata]